MDMVNYAVFALILMHKTEPRSALWGYTVKPNRPMELIVLSIAFLTTLATTYMLLTAKMQLLKKELERRSE